MSEFRIRRAGPDDAECLSHIGVATFIESYSQDIDGVSMVTHCSRQHARAVYEQYLAAPTSTLWIAEYAATGAPIGYALNCPPDLPVPLEPGDIELKRIYTLSRFHGTGIGAALLEASFSDARARAAPRLLLGTYKENHRAVAFYTKKGFTLAGTRKFQVGDRLFDDIVLAKRL
jgi:ribosomal protein S18 acetylase RimI-like enzyme